VAVFSGFALAAEVERRGLAFFLLKPFSTSDLLAQIARTLDRPAPPAEDAAVIARYFQAIERGAWSALSALCTEDVAYHLPGADPRFSRTVTGRAAFAAFAEETFREFPAPAFEITSMRALPLGIIVEYASAWGTPTGRRRTTGSLLFTMRDGAIEGVGVRVDLAGLHRDVAAGDEVDARAV
jgi:ketosteroid isomerase-like protein